MFRMTTTVLRMTTPEQISQRLAEVVVAAIKAAGHSQRDVAEASGIPLVTLNRRLTGRSSFTIPEIAAISEVIDTGVTELFLRVERSFAQAA